MKRKLRIDREDFEVLLLRGEAGAIRVRIGDAEFDVGEVQRNGARLTFMLNGARQSFDALTSAERVLLSDGENYFEATVVEPGSAASAAHGAAELVSRMPGKVLAQLVPPGTRVTKGQALLILEAMKMENEILAPADGTVESFPFAEGARVMPGDLLVQFVADGSA